MRWSKQLAIGASIAIIVTFGAMSYLAVSGFNPYPQTATISTASVCTFTGGGCPGFEIDSASLSIRYFQGITSQQLVLTITPTGNSAVQNVNVYFDSVPLGIVKGPFEPGVPATVNATIPTTFTLTVGSTHQVVLEATYVSSTGEANATYWDSTSVTVQ